MRTVDELIRLKEERGLTIADIAKRSGVPVGTVGKILSGQTKKPRTATLNAIERALKDGMFDGVGKAAWYELMKGRPETGPGVLCEPKGTRYGELDSGSPSMNQRALTYGSAALKKRQGEYTVEDYYALPDDVRVELIDGVFYDMAAPTPLHQDLALELWVRLRNHIRQGKGLCKAYMSPIDVKFPEDEMTMVQPDVIVVCDRDKIIEKRIDGAPDLVIEVLSPSTKKKDQAVKLKKYGEMGVREYWIVDPASKKVVVYVFERDWEISLYSFSDQIPVAIFEGQCVIDMAELYGGIRDLYEP